ncbi:MAG: polyprenyl diphosphate synthase [Pseudohongiellaceae bacterium]
MSSEAGEIAVRSSAGWDKQPRHVVVIMDGNNRWARSRRLKGSAGHRAGAEAAKRLVYGCVERGIPWLTLFAFSSENWLRSDREVKGLMALFLNVLRRREIRELHGNNVRLQFIGNRAGFPQRLQQHMQDVEELTGDNTGTVVNVAADYGGRWDIVRACQRLAAEVAEGRLSPGDIDPAAVQEQICLGDAPDPDLCIRTGGELRISNFLLWQMAYTELYFTRCLWPDFNDHELQAALDAFSHRQRRYGHLEPGTDEAGGGATGSDENPAAAPQARGGSRIA